MQRLKIELLLDEIGLKRTAEERRYRSDKSIGETLMTELTVPIDGVQYSLLDDLRSTREGIEWLRNYQEVRELRGRKNKVKDFLVKASKLLFKPLDYSNRSLKEAARIKSLSTNAAYANVEMFTIDSTDKLFSWDGSFKYVIKPTGEIEGYELYEKGTRKRPEGWLFGTFDGKNIGRRWTLSGLMDKLEGHKLPVTPLTFMMEMQNPLYNDEIGAGFLPSTIRFRLAT